MRACTSRRPARGIKVEYGKRLAGAHPAHGGVVARFGDGTSATGDLLVGADGVHSATRALIDPAVPAPRYVGLVNFGGYTPGVAMADPGTWYMVFGKRAFFGYATDPSGGTVWFANVPRPPDQRCRASGHHRRAVAAAAARAVRGRPRPGDRPDRGR